MESCKECARPAGCIACKRCPLHLDRQDKSWTIAVLYQQHRTPAESSALFVIGDAAFPIRGGSAFVFDGRTTPHGLWAPHAGDTAIRYPWYGCVLLNRR
jgi:hypothetical protein